MSIHELLKNRAAGLLSSALMAGSRASLTYAALFRQIESTASALYRRQITREIVSLFYSRTGQKAPLHVSPSLQQRLALR